MMEQPILVDLGLIFGKGLTNIVGVVRSNWSAFPVFFFKKVNLNSYFVFPFRFGTILFKSD